MSELADIAEITRQQIWNIETGYSLPYEATLQALMDALGESDLNMLKER